MVLRGWLPIAGDPLRSNRAMLHHPPKTMGLAERA
jgi:hypothetical protein